MRITRLDIQPSYADGFAFSWELDPVNPPPAGVLYRVQRGDTHEGPWTDISPVLSGVYMWAGDGERVIHTKTHVLYFRVAATAGGKDYYSPVVQPYADIADKREFLIARNMRRHELIQMRGMGGTACRVFVKAVFGPRCTRCVDFVSGRPARQDCAVCFGTGTEPGYHGPYDALARFSANQQNPGFQEGTRYVTEPSQFRLRMLGLPAVKKDDIVVDAKSDRRYMVNTVVSTVEVRRVPIVRVAEVSEITSSSPYYRVGAAES